MPKQFMRGGRKPAPASFETVLVLSLLWGSRGLSTLLLEDERILQYGYCGIGCVLEALAMGECLRQRIRLPYNPYCFA